MEVRGPQDLEGAFASLSQSRVDALMVPGSTMLSANSERVVALAAKHRLPAIYNNPKIR
jgi:putative ABC transport system substrate-binding protein